MTASSRIQLKGNLDILVFSRERNSQLLNSLKVWRKQPYRFIILHNSKIGIPEKLISENVVYKHLPGMGYGDRAGLAPTYIESEFATILADDEMLLDSGIEEMLHNLKSKPHLTSIGGKVLGIHKYGMQTTGAFAYRNMYNYENVEADKIRRLTKHLVEPINGEMPRASMYRIMRSESLKSILALFSKLTFVESPYIYEVAGEFAVAASGPTSTINNLYWIRNWENRMVQHKNWDRSLNFTDWWFNEMNAEKKNTVIRLLSGYAKIDPNETRRLLNQYLERRLLIELNGNRQASSIQITLSQIKQRIFTIFKIVEKSIDILSILEQEDLEQQNDQKAAIAILCRNFLAGEWDPDL